MKKQHPLVTTLKNLRGNPRACVFTEPLWGIPFNLYTPYASLYMAALGLTDTLIGVVASLGMVFQVLFALLSGIITDKLGRKRTTFIFDIVSWTIPCLIWAIAQDFAYFALAAVINSMWRVTMNSWSCLLVEDCPEEQLVGVWAWVHISGLLAAFFAPVAGLFVSWHGLVPTVRVLYAFSLVMMTTKFIVLNVYAQETRQGVVRLAETKGVGLLVMLRQYGGVIQQILHTPRTLLTLGILLVMNISLLVQGTFWPLLVTERLQISVEWVAVFPFLRSVVMLAFYFWVVPRFSARAFRNPMLVGFGMLIMAQLLLVTAPPLGYGFLLASILLEAGSLAMINPLLDSMLVITVNPNERARINAILYAVVIGFSSPFGYVAGTLSEVNRTLPFLMTMGLFTMGALLTYTAAAVAKQRPQIVA